MQLYVFPWQWKYADVVVLQKPGKAATFPQNYKAISLLPIMGKIVERVILTKLKNKSKS